MVKLKYDLFESKWFKLLQISMDVGIIIIGYRLAFFVRFGFDAPQRNIEPFYRLMPFIILVSILFFHVYLSEEDDSKSYFDRVYFSVVSIAMIQFATVTLSFFIRGFAFPRSVILISAALQIMAMAIWKKCLVHVYRKYHRANRVIIIGGAETSSRVVSNILGLELDHIVVAKDVEGIEGIEETDMEEIDSICITSDIKGAEREKIIEHAVSENKALYIVPDFHEIVLRNTVWSQFDDMPVLKARKPSMTLEQRIYKRIFDLAVALPVLVLFLPLMGIISILIWIEDKGPVLYRQERLTVGGRAFMLLKFRTMVVDAEKHTGPVLADLEDDRITAVGKVLRASRLDELPQLFNVIKGDLSLVGPRPERAFFYDKYGKVIPEFRHRLSVKAGVTGMGQVFGKYTTTPKDKLVYDMLYIYSYSILLDLKILFKTFAILFKSGSAEGNEAEKAEASAKE